MEISIIKIPVTFRPVIRSETSNNAANLLILFHHSAKVNNDHEEMWEYIKEGFMSAFAAFMVRIFYIHLFALSRESLVQ